MSGFDPQWLALREPADARARNSEILALCVARFSTRANVSVVDLGCGAGSNLRALSPNLPARQRWRLVDHDSRLLGSARQTLVAWAENSVEKDGRLQLEKGGKSIEVEFVQADLVRDLALAVDCAADLVTAAALFDLTSEEWLRHFVSLLAGLGRPLYTTLIYNGVEDWTPAHPADRQMLDAFRRHQTTDKGFGAAAGPNASRVLEDCLRAAGYETHVGASDWNLSSHDTELVAQLAEGIANACLETGLVAPAIVADWLQARRTASARIGHFDLFASPN